MESNVSIPFIPVDILNLIFQCLVNDEPNEMSCLEPAKHLFEKYRYLNSVIRTCKAWYNIGIKLVNLSECGCYLLKNACSKRDVFMAGYFLKDSRVDPNISYDYCLFYACHRDFPDIAKMLMTNVRFKLTDELPKMALAWCAEMGSINTLKYLIGDQKIDPSSGGNTCLIIACIGGKDETVDMLLRDERTHNMKEYEYEGEKMFGSQPKRSKRCLSVLQSKNKALRYAMKFSHDNICNMLLDRGRLVPTAKEFCKACRFGKFSIAKRMIPMMHELNVCDEFTPVDCAMIYGSEDLLNELCRDPRVDVAYEQSIVLLDTIRYAGFNQEKSIRMTKALLSTGKVDPIPRILDILESLNIHNVKIVEIILSSFKEMVIEYVRDNPIEMVISFDIPNECEMLQFIFKKKIKE